MNRACWIFLWLLAAASASALEVQRAMWGFNGLAVPGRFNVLSVLVANPGDTPFDGSLNLHKSRGLEQRVGAIYTAPCYVSPGVARWVQFYVYVDNPYDQWRLNWGQGPNDRFDMDPPKLGPAARVYLSDAETRLAATQGLREFPEELFPPTATALGGLDAVVMDHPPRWEPAKRQAFVNWLRAGGEADVAAGADGHYPVFSDELGVLNSPLDQTRVGAGLVKRLPGAAREARDLDIEARRTPQAFKPEEMGPFQVSDRIFGALSVLSRPRHNWSLIYLLAITYVAAAGPGVFLFGKRFADYRLRILLLIATVAAFTLLFNFVGRRGQGEASVVHTLSYARRIDGDSYEVTQWINVFATYGDQYTITHAAPHNLYATGQDYESVNGLIQGGRNGKFLVDIPMFSRRALLHQAEMKGATIPISVASWETAGAPGSFQLTLGGEFSKQVLGAWAVRGDRFYSLTLNGNRLAAADPRGTPLSELVSPGEFAQYGYGMPYMIQNDNDASDVEGQFRKSVKPIICWSLGDTNFPLSAIAPFSAPAQLHVFLFARSPEAFAIVGSKFGREIGYVVYDIDLFPPGS